MNLDAIWIIRGYVGHQGYNMAKWIWNTLCQHSYVLDHKSYVPYHKWFTAQRIKVSYISIFDADVPLSLDPPTSQLKLYYLLQTFSCVIPHSLSMVLSYVYNEYSIHTLRHTRRTTNTKCSTRQVQLHPRIDSLPLTYSLSFYLLGDLAVLQFLHSNDYKLANE